MATTPFYMLGPHAPNGKPVFYQRQAVPRDVRRRLGLPNSKRISVSWVKRMIGVRAT